MDSLFTKQHYIEQLESAHRTIEELKNTIGDLEDDMEYWRNLYKRDEDCYHKGHSIGSEEGYCEGYEEGYNNAMNEMGRG